MIVADRKREDKISAKASSGELMQVVQHFQDILSRKDRRREEEREKEMKQTKEGKHGGED